MTTHISESTIEQYLVKRCKQHNILCFKFTSPSTRGVPDRILIYDTQVIFVELKRPKQKPRKSQEYVFNKIRAQHVPLYVIDNLDDIDRLINRLIGKKEGL